MANSMDLSQLVKFFSVVFYACLYPIIGFILGHILVYICKPPENFKRSLVMSVTFGNAAFIPLSLITTVFYISGNPFSEIPNAEYNAISYISVYVSIFSLIYWTVSPSYLAGNKSTITKKDDEEVDVDVDVDDTESKDKTQILEEGLVVCEEEIEYDDDSIQLEEINRNIDNFLQNEDNEINDDRLDNNVSSLEEGINKSNPDESIDTDDANEAEEETTVNGGVHNSIIWINYIILLNYKLISFGKSFFKRIWTPPTIAVLLGFIIGVVGPLKYLFFGSEDSNEDGETSSQFIPLGFLTGAMNMLGAAALPCAMMVLGANLSKGPATSVISKKTIILASVTKLIIIPLISVILTVALSYYNILPDDPVLKFVLMIEGATPTAMSLVIICQMNNSGEKEMSSLQFWIYIASSITLTFFVSVYLMIL
eukprot:TRINITY_DN445_c0_g1_i1.p1 TRINITY_DN445_c0_g1~~TRINITY_DN445_c0_g1_i1.p1  ORF type:complete len:425 (-),score=137.00 TRINITY_DN445_c0_g1_i1:74-1348(-)